MSLKKKCQKCRVAEMVGGCLLGCSKKERLTRELDLLIEQADSNVDPVVEQLKQCPEAFTVGQAVERLFQFIDSEHNDRILPPSGTVMSPFV
jgi:hypothetical protein